ncbi:MAG: hypothetical protein L3J89_06630 [Gammaproteobacteria bacterium]|nr:hypothetical protein [Gammaproteobacteria bacterium]
MSINILHNKIACGCTLIFSVCSLIATLAQAETEIRHSADLPEYRVGETFIFTNNRVEHIEKNDGDMITISSRKGQQYVRHRNFLLPVIQWQLAGKSGHRTIHGNADDLWPLSIGNSASFRVLTRIYDDVKQHEIRRVALWRCHVAAQENIHVSAGKFSSYRIICDHFSKHSMRILRRHTWHYSPAVGHYVRRDVKNFLTGDHYHYELLASLPPGHNNALRIKAIENNSLSEKK